MCTACIACSRMSMPSFARLTTFMLVWIACTVPHSSSAWGNGREAGLPGGRLGRQRGGAGQKQRDGEEGQVAGAGRLGLLRDGPKGRRVEERHQASCLP